MRFRHVIKRGNSYSFVGRIPKDLLHLFPAPTIWKPIKGIGTKNVRLLATVLEPEVQKIFPTLRTVWY